jgi:uncharacterized protein (DUF2236 family)
MRLETSINAANTSRAGLFTPDSLIWRVHRENIVMLAGSRALLMELAHPMVAAGVAHHSDFRRRPLHRLFNTLRVMQRLSFGSGESAKHAARRIHGCHQHVHGEHHGEAYTASDPALRLWVYATLVDSTLVVYERFVKPLNKDERESYYADWKVMGRMMGIPASYLPPTHDDFNNYIHTMLTDGSLCVGDTALEVMQALFHYPAIGPMLRLVSAPGIGLLPDSLRDAYNLAWTPRDAARLDWLSGGFRRIRRYLPVPIAVQPDAWIAEMRFRS